MRKTRYEKMKIWRKKYPELRYQDKRLYHKKNRESLGLDNNVRLWWRADEIHAITSLDRPSDRVLSEKLKRSIASIQTKRSKIKKSNYINLLWSTGMIFDQ